MTNQNIGFGLFRALSFSGLAWLAAAGLASAQTVGTVRGTVEDPLGGVLASASVRLSSPASGLTRETASSADGTFVFENVPLDLYLLDVEAPGFTPRATRVPVRTPARVELSITLELAAQFTSVTVTPADAPLDATATGTRNLVSESLIQQLPTPVGSRGLESVLVTFPGFAQNANGAIHPRGAHNQMTFVVDGLAISDQLTGAFANALDASIVQTVELMTGNVPAEFGSKVSGVAVVTSRSGLGIDRRAAGDVSIARAGFDTWNVAAQMGGGGHRFGYFASVNAMRTDRFLDQVSRTNLHNAGGFGRGFVRLDTRLSDRGWLRLHAMGGQSRFELANQRSQNAAGQDQQQTLGDGAAWVTAGHTVGPRATIESTVGYRVSGSVLTPSRGDTPVTANQSRRLGTFSLAGRYTRTMTGVTIRAGGDLVRFPAHERFSMAVTSPRFNAPDTDRFNASLLAHDVTRGGTPFVFEAARTGQLGSLFAQATIERRAVTVTAGLRHDEYSFLVRGRQLQPRIGVSYALPGSAGVVRASYNRNYQTPPNENLLLSSSPEAAALAPDSVKQTLGGAFRPIRPERQNAYELGYRTRQAGTMFDVSLYRKDSTDQQDNNNFFDTGIIFPTALAGIRVEGAELRITPPVWHGVSSTVSATTGRAVSRPPFTGGLFLGQDAVDLLSAGPFRIDHDQALSVQGTLQIDMTRGWWTSLSTRYDSGLVANPSDPAAVAADPDFADLLPYVDLTAPVPRVRPRTIVDAGVGYDIRAGTRRVWSLQVQVTNVTNRIALYNFQSVFVGTRLVQPRTVAVRVRRYF